MDLSKATPIHSIVEESIIRTPEEEMNEAIRIANELMLNENSTVTTVQEDITFKVKTRQGW